MNRELRKSTREQRSKSVIKNSDKLAENQSQTQLSEEQQDQRIQSSPAGQTRLSEEQQDQRIQSSPAGQTRLSVEQQDQRIQSSPAGQTRLSVVERPISPISS